MDQVPPPLVIVFDYTWDTKGIHGPVCFSQPGDGYENKCYIKLCFCQREIQPNTSVLFVLQGRVLHILVNNPTNMMCYCCGK